MISRKPTSREVLRHEDQVAIVESDQEPVHLAANQMLTPERGPQNAQPQVRALADTSLESKRQKAIDEVRKRRLSESGSIYLDDAPTADDSLGIGDSISLVTSLITSLDTGTPFVLGIDGAWGSGKTSLCFAVERHLQETEGCITCWVNAWRFEKVPQLATALVTALRHDIFERYQKSRHNIDDRTACEDQLTELARRAANEELWLDGGTEAHLEDLLFSLLPAETVRKARCVVFLDDLDRCSPKQLAAALKLLRPLTAAWGMVVVLPCDRARVRTTLEENPEIGEPVESESMLAGDTPQAHGVDAFLERIVRVWVAMPVPKVAT